MTNIFFVEKVSFDNHHVSSFFFFLFFVTGIHNNHQVSKTKTLYVCEIVNI